MEITDILNFFESKITENCGLSSLSQKLNFTTADSITASGIVEAESYQLANQDVRSFAIGNVRSQPFPTVITDQLRSRSSSVTMGCFVEINRAWMALDNELYMWGCDDGGDLVCFDGLKGAIVAAACLHVKPGILQPFVDYLLALASSHDLSFFGVSFTNPNTGAYDRNEIFLIPEPMFVLSTDSQRINCIRSTTGGRIFYACDDACLYEVVCLPKPTWSGQRCYKINHSKTTWSTIGAIVSPAFMQSWFSSDDPLVDIVIDEGRSLLSTLSKSGCIQMFGLGTDQTTFCRIGQLSAREIEDKAARANGQQNADRSFFKNVVHLSLVSAANSSDICLVAVTKLGARLYFACHKRPSPPPSQSLTHQQSAPFALAIIHVRIPPSLISRRLADFGSNPSDPSGRSFSITAVAVNETFLLAAGQPGLTSSVIGFSGDFFASLKHFKEHVFAVQFSGTPYALLRLKPDNGASDNLCQPNIPVLVQQHLLDDETFLLMTTDGCHYFQCYRPLTQLRQALLGTGARSNECQQLASQFSAVEFATMCLLLACQVDGDLQLANAARQAFHLYAFTSAELPPQPPVLPPAGGASSPSTPLPVKLDAILLCLSRILQPVWKRSVVRAKCIDQRRTEQTRFSAVQLLSTFVRPSSSQSTEQGSFVQSSCRPEALSPILERLKAIVRFCRKDLWAEFALPAMKPANDFVSSIDAKQRDRDSYVFSGLIDLTEKAAELVGLWRLLAGHDMRILFERLYAVSPSLADSLLTLTFKEWVTASDNRLSRSLIHALLHLYLEDQQSMDVIIVRLKEACPSIYSEDDGKVYGGFELVRLANSNPNEIERLQQIRSAVKLFSEGAAVLPLEEACRQLINVKYYEGLVDVCLACARAADPADLAVRCYYKTFSDGVNVNENYIPDSNMPALKQCSVVWAVLRTLPADSVEYSTFLQRHDCYAGLLTFFSHLLKLAPTPDAVALELASMDGLFQRLLQLALSAKDELLHVAIYEWLIENDQKDVLLETKTPDLLIYLRHRLLAFSDDLTSLTLMWRYCEAVGEMEAAAVVLMKLVDSRRADVTLQHRIEHLARAIVCLKSASAAAVTATPDIDTFLADCHAKLGVANLQLAVRNALRTLRPTFNVNAAQFASATSKAVAELDSQLFDISTLYSEFIEFFELHVCKLLAFRCSGFADSAAIEDVWRQIIDSELALPSTGAASTKVLNANEGAARLELIISQFAVAGSEHYLPLRCIVKSIESAAMKHCFDFSFTFDCLEHCGVGFRQLLAVYDELYRHRDFQAPIRLVAGISYRLTKALFNVDSIFLSPAEKRAFLSSWYNNISMYLVELNGDLSANTQPIISSLRDLQNRIDALIA